MSYFSTDKKQVAILEYRQYSRDPLSLPLEYTVTSLGPDRRHSKLTQSGSRPVSICHGVSNGFDLGEFVPDEKIKVGWESHGKNKGKG